MKYARAVIGANFGDEGKGLVTDWLCSEGAGIVVRFNGGAQAGHTVVTPDGQRHVFSHFGAGTFVGIPTFLSQFFVVNPILFRDERAVLIEKGVNLPDVYAHPGALVSTFADMMINQKLEQKRGDKRHGSCGVGVNETIVRSEVEQLRITVGDLWNNPSSLRRKLEEICNRYAEFRCGEKVPDADKYIDAFLKVCEGFAKIVRPGGIAYCHDPVFEGAQGLLLDQDNREFFPHLTRSHTGAQNVLKLCEQGGFDLPKIYYVSRTYLTRHGAGPLPGEDPNLHYHDDTNYENDHQGRLRFAKFDAGSLEALKRRIRQDARAAPYSLVFTHCDQQAPPCTADYYFYGPTRDHLAEKIRDDRRIA